MEDLQFPLENEWCIYYDRSMLRDAASLKPGVVDQTTWTSQQNKVGVFSTVAGFWSYWNNLVAPSRLPMEGTYSCFLSHIQPAWEDKENLHGGEIRMFFGKQAGASVDQAWSNLLMAAVGETLSNERFSICGLTVSRKKHKSKIAVWINRCDPESITALEDGIRTALGHDTVSRLGLQLDWTNHQQLLDKEHRKESFGSTLNNSSSSLNSSGSQIPTGAHRAQQQRSNNNMRVARPPSISGEAVSHH